jgi:hypothetical protein
LHSSFPWSNIGSCLIKICIMCTSILAWVSATLSKLWTMLLTETWVILPEIPLVLHILLLLSSFLLQVLKFNYKKQIYLLFRIGVNIHDFFKIRSPNWNAFGCLGNEISCSRKECICRKPSGLKIQIVCLSETLVSTYESMASQLTTSPSLLPREPQMSSGSSASWVTSVCSHSNRVL